ncbi:MAG: hypothetical protein H6695_16110 [Deferribacteres bacterium]|nr:hypothetical protein [candidate division KSB1 bacterium]MCB9511713.1 hypothetical protein [Deferribacteres bacterium]
METIMRGLSAGFVVGVICVIYVVFRISKVHEQLEAEGVDLYKDEKKSTSWMIMAIFSSGSIVWAFVGAAIYRMVQNHFYFVFFSICTGFILSVIIYFRKDTPFKGDKIVLTLIMTIGIGLLIPYLLP